MSAATEDNNTLWNLCCICQFLIQTWSRESLRQSIAGYEHLAKSIASLNAEVELKQKIKHLNNGSNLLDTLIKCNATRPATVSLVKKSWSECNKKKKKECD